MNRIRRINQLFEESKLTDALLLLAVTILIVIYKMNKAYLSGL